jgi:hypothetical protein
LAAFAVAVVVAVAFLVCHPRRGSAFAVAAASFKVVILNEGSLYFAFAVAFARSSSKLQSTGIPPVAHFL